MSSEPDDTFASTLTGINELRSKYGGDDWPEWRRTVVDAVRAGERLEREVQSLRLKTNGFAKAEAYQGLSDRIKVLEGDRKIRNSVGKYMADFIKALIVAGVTLFLAKVFK